MIRRSAVGRGGNFSAVRLPRKEENKGQPIYTEAILKAQFSVQPFSRL
jgi:hypothetical protein